MEKNKISTGTKVKPFENMKDMCNDRLDTWISKRQEGTKLGRNEGRKEGRKKGRKEGRKEGRKMRE